MRVWAAENINFLPVIFLLGFQVFEKFSVSYFFMLEQSVKGVIKDIFLIVFKRFEFYNFDTLVSFLI
jgi:hypothetical protein